MNSLQVVGTDQNIPAKLDVAKRALAEATEDWQRVDIRNYARAVAAATAILERKDIQVQAANLVQDAERAIAKANPPISAEERSKRVKKGISQRHETNDTYSPNGAISSTNPPITQSQLNHIRQAHKDLSDEEFEEKKTKAIETGIPLTQRELREEARRKRQLEKHQERESQLAEEKEQIELMIEENPSSFLHIRLDEGLVNWHNVLAHTGGPGKGNDLGKMTIAEVRQLQKDFQRVMHPDKNSWYAERTHQEQLNWIALRGVIEAVLEALERQITINVTGGKHEKL